MLTGYEISPLFAHSALCHILLWTSFCIATALVITYKMSGGLFTKNCVFATTLLFPLHNVWIYNKTITLYTYIHTSQMMHTCLDCQPNLITTSETITLPSMWTIYRVFFVLMCIDFKAICIKWILLHNISNRCHPGWVVTMPTMKTKA